PLPARGLRAVPGRGAPPLRVRRTDGVPATSRPGRAATHRVTAAAGAADLQPAEGAGGRTRCGHRLVRGLDAARAGRAAVVCAAEPHPGNRSARAHRTARAWSPQPAGVGSSPRARPVLRARPLLPGCLL